MDRPTAAARAAPTGPSPKAPCSGIPTSGCSHLSIATQDSSCQWRSTPWGDANLDVAASLGRIIRDRGLSTTVGMTYPQICARETESACFELKRTASTPLNSELHVTRLHCDLACLLILSGGVRRTIPRDTKLKISGTEIFNRFGASVSEQRREGLTTFYSDRTRRYFAEMGIDPEIMDMLKRANDSPRAIELPASEWTRLRLVTDAAP